MYLFNDCFLINLEVLLIMISKYCSGIIQHAGDVEIVVDPGNNNIMYVHFYRNGVLVHTIRLTRNEYYQDSMLNYSRLRWLVWNRSQDMKALIDGMCNHHFKTSNMEQLQESINHYQGTRINICNMKLIPNKFESLNFFTYTRKNCTIQRFLSKLVKLSGEVRPIMFYGDGQFAPGGRGQRSVPCKWVKRECQHFFRCYSVDEFRTSQICPTCNDRLYNVRKHLRNGKTIWVRGLKYCPSDICSANRYKDRDDVGCHNIYRKTRVTFPAVMEQFMSKF